MQLVNAVSTDIAPIQHIIQLIADFRFDCLVTGHFVFDFDFDFTLSSATSVFDFSDWLEPRLGLDLVSDSDSVSVGHCHSFSQGQSLDYKSRRPTTTDSRKETECSV